MLVLGVRIRVRVRVSERGLGHEPSEYKKVRIRNVWKPIIVVHRRTFLVILFVIFLDNHHSSEECSAEEQ